MRCLALASYDSFLNAARLIAPHFRDAGCAVEYALVKARKRDQITASQVDAMAPGKAISWITIENLVQTKQLSEYDIVLSCLEGFSTRQLMYHVQSLKKRPLIISVYPGLVLRYAYDGFSMRTASDLLWLNSKSDLTAYRDMCAAFGLPSDNARVFGVAPLLSRPKRKLNAESGPVVFFEQAIIPRYRTERLFLCEQLLRLAQKFPQYEFLIKPRVTGGEATLHRSWHPIIPLLQEASAKLDARPPNLRISTASSADLLEVASHCLTVSSTVAVEAMNAGIPTAILGDFGAHEDYGLHFFFKSGIIYSFKDLDFPITRRPDTGWVENSFTDPSMTVHELVLEAVQMASGKKGELSSEMQRAEMSSQLRKRLYESHGTEDTLTRQYQGRGSQRHRLWQKLSRLLQRDSTNNS